MKVIIKDTNEIKNVSFGYAVNYLIPQGLAVMATPQALEEFEKQQAASSKRQEKRKKQEENLVEKLRGKIITIEKKVGKGKKIFGSVKKKDILKAAGTDSDLVEVLLDTPIKTLGKHKATLKIGKRKVKVKVSVKKLRNK